MGIETQPGDRGKVSSVSEVTPGAVPDAERFVDLFDALFPEDQQRFFEWAESSWYGTLDTLRYRFRTSPDGFHIPTAELIGGLLRAGYRLNPRDLWGQKIEDPRVALHEGHWSSGPEGT